jgi:hypothetical protein
LETDVGYNTYVSGSLTVTPKLSDKQLEKLGLEENSSTDDHSLFVGFTMGEEDTVGVVKGEITVIPGKSYTRIECRYDSSFKAYDLPEQFVDLANALTRAGHKIEGAFYLDGEDASDFSRLRVDEKGVPHHEEPEWVWPNGDKGWG